MTMYGDLPEGHPLRELDTARQRVRSMPPDGETQRRKAAYEALMALKEHLEVLAFTPLQELAGAKLLLEQLVSGDLVTHPHEADFERIRFPGATAEMARDLDEWRAVGSDLAAANDAMQRAILNDDGSEPPVWAWRLVSYAVRAIHGYLRTVERELAAAAVTSESSGATSGAIDAANGQYFASLRASVARLRIDLEQRRPRPIRRDGMPLGPGRHKELVAQFVELEQAIEDSGRGGRVRPAVEPSASSTTRPTSRSSRRSRPALSAAKPPNEGLSRR